LTLFPSSRVIGLSMKRHPPAWLKSFCSHRTGYCTLLFYLVYQLQVSIRADEIPGLAIKDVKICQQVKGHQPVDILEHPEQRVPNKPVWVWIKLSGTEESLAHLNFGKELPLKTVWLYLGNAPVQLSADGDDPDPEPPPTIEGLRAKYNAPPVRTLTLGKIKHKDKLKSETKERGEHRWDWRTASEKTNLWPGYYQIFFKITGGGYLDAPNGKHFLELNYAP
jgi:hypothetical protein